MHDHHLRISLLCLEFLGGVIGGLVPLGRPFEVDFGSLPVEDALVIRRPPGQSGFGEVRTSVAATTHLALASRRWWT